MLIETNELPLSYVRHHPNYNEQTGQNFNFIDKIMICTLTTVQTCVDSRRVFVEPSRQHQPQHHGNAEHEEISRRVHVDILKVRHAHCRQNAFNIIMSISI